MSDTEDHPAGTAEPTAPMTGKSTSNSAINSHVPLPPHFIASGDPAARWKKYKQLWDSFEIVTGLKENKR